MKKLFIPICLLLGVLFLIGAASTTTSFFKSIQADNVTATTNITASTAAVGVVSATKAYRAYQGTLTHAGTVTLDFDAATTVNALTITGNVTFATSNLATNRTYRVKITGTSTNAVPTFPATWKFLGGAPVIITASKVSMLSLEAWGTTDATVVAAFAEAP